MKKNKKKSSKTVTLFSLLLQLWLILDWLDVWINPISSHKIVSPCTLSFTTFQWVHYIHKPLIIYRELSQKTHKPLHCVKAKNLFKKELR